MRRDRMERYEARPVRARACFVKIYPLPMATARFTYIEPRPTEPI